MTNIELESNYDSMSSRDCDMIVLEILTEQIFNDLGDLLKSVDLYKKSSLTNVDDYNNKKELITNIMAPNNCDEDYMAKIVSFLVKMYNSKNVNCNLNLI